MDKLHLKIPIMLDGISQDTAQNLKVKSFQYQIECLPICIYENG